MSSLTRDPSTQEGKIVDLGGRLIIRSEEHTSELQSHSHLVCRLRLEQKKTTSTSCRVATAGLRARTRSPSSSCTLSVVRRCLRPFFFFNDAATTEIYTLSLHGALPISVVALS